MDVQDREFDMLVEIYDVCDTLRDSESGLDHGSLFVINAMSQRMYNFYKDNIRQEELNLTIEILNSTVETLQEDEDFELCYVYFECIKLLKKYQHEQKVLLSQSEQGNDKQEEKE